MPPFRRLKVYAFDPTRGSDSGNYMAIPTPYEPLTRGPVGRHLAVVDYDANGKCYYAPVDLDDPAILMRNGLDPSESDPWFHQQMVYAVASQTISEFEFALGRSIKWSFNRWRKRAQEGKAGARPERLRLLPHAMQEANAYYSRDLRAILFGYFSASKTDPGANIPGQTVFTCLTHDIIAHEITHALVDSQKDHFMEQTSADALAFHEAFADIVALFQHFTFKEPLVDIIRRTGGMIFRPLVAPENPPTKEGPTIQAELPTDNPLIDLARQFGEAMGLRAALRSAIGTRPNSRDIDEFVEPHKRGSILVAAVFDAFFSAYLRRTERLRRIAQETGRQSSTDLSLDLVNSLAETATKIAGDFLTMCIQALDYCPPVDMLFGDFLRALITVDYDTVPDDEFGYRAALIKSFQSRGIIPEGVGSFSEESLRWNPPEVDLSDKPLRCEGLRFDVFNPSKEEVNANADTLREFGKRNAVGLGLSPEFGITLGSFHRLHRVGPDGSVHFGMVAEYIQQRPVSIDPKTPNSPKFTFRGGTTVVFGRQGEVLYSIHKSVGHEGDDESNDRLRRQREYLASLEGGLNLAAYVDSATAYATLERMDFRLAHRGY